jgi:hypothetical protein
MQLVTFRLRNPTNFEETYGQDFSDEAEAVERARQLADFYRHPVEVCQLVGGHVLVGVAEVVDPGPTAPRG